MNGFRVLDNALDENEFIEIATLTAATRCRPVDRPGGAWNAKDGQPRASDAIVASLGDRSTVSAVPLARAGLPSRLPRYAQLVLGLLGRRADLVSAVAPRFDAASDLVVFRTYEHPPGSGLSWHVDESDKTAGFILYCSPVWNDEWGGELLIENGVESPTPAPGTGFGHFVAPLPNRLVVIDNRTRHKVSQVNSLATAACRRTVAGFVKRSRPERH